MFSGVFTFFLFVYVGTMMQNNNFHILKTLSISRRFHKYIQTTEFLIVLLYFH